MAEWASGPPLSREPGLVTLYRETHKPINHLKRNALMNPNKALWEKDDFTRIAQSMRESGEALVQRLTITKGLKVLDLGCGDGTTALPAAKLGGGRRYRQESG